MKKALLSTLAAVLVVLLQGWIAPAAKANSIVWQTPVAINTNDPTQVLTNGVVLVASDTITPYTVNGVSFSGTLDTLVTNFTNEGSATPATGTNYAKMLASGMYRQSGATATIHITSLTIGKLYEVELFTPFWNADFESKFSDGANSVPMGNTAAVPTLVVGTFTADTTTKLISFDAVSPTGSFGLLSAFQVLAVPEPASGVLLALGSLVALRRRRSA